MAIIISNSNGKPIYEQITSQINPLALILRKRHIGKGSFVAGSNHEILKEEQFRLVEEYLQKAVDIARGSGITMEEMADIIQMLYEEV